MSIRSTLSFIAQVLPVDWLASITERKIILPFYHTISDAWLPHISHLYPLKSKKQFVKDIDFLCRHFIPVDIGELKQIVYGKRHVYKPIMHLTFDDGLKEIFSEIAPILLQKGIPATLFVNSAFIDNKRLFYRFKISLIIDQLYRKNSLNREVSVMLKNPGLDLRGLKARLLSLTWNETTLIDEIAVKSGLNIDEYLKRNQPFLTSIQLKKLIEQGFTIGSHSVDHPFFKDIELYEQKHQITECSKFITNTFHSNDLYFSFPFTDENVSKELFDWLYTEAACALSFGTSGLKDDDAIYHLHRIPMEGKVTHAREIVNSEYLYYILKFLFRKNKISRQ